MVMRDCDVRFMGGALSGRWTSFVNGGESDGATPHAQQTRIHEVVRVCMESVSLRRFIKGSTLSAYLERETPYHAQYRKPQLEVSTMKA